MGKNLVKTDIEDALQSVEIILREGIALQKGVVLTQLFLEGIEGLLKEYMDYFIQYPDCFLDMIKPVDSNFNLFFYQRMVLRAIMRYKDVYIVACRAFSKSFISILGIMLQCIFMPGKIVPPYFVRSIETAT